MFVTTTDRLLKFVTNLKWLTVLHYSSSSPTTTMPTLVMNPNYFLSLLLLRQYSADQQLNCGFDPCLRGTAGTRRRSTLAVPFALLFALRTAGSATNSAPS